jgi:hypothetical protein
MRRCLRYIIPIDVNATAGHRQQSGDHPKRGCLSTSRWPEQAEKLAAGEIERQIVHDGQLVAVVFRDAFELEEVCLRRLRFVRYRSIQGRRIRDAPSKGEVFHGSLFVKGKRGTILVDQSGPQRPAGRIWRRHGSRSEVRMSPIFIQSTAISFLRCSGSMKGIRLAVASSSVALVLLGA